MARRVHAWEEDGGDDEGGVSTASGEEEDGVDSERGDTLVQQDETDVHHTTSFFRYEERSHGKRGHGKAGARTGEERRGTMGTGCHSMVEDRLADASTNKTQDGQEVDFRVNLGLIEDLYKGRAIDAEGHGKGPIDGYSGRDKK